MAPKVMAMTPWPRSDTRTMRASGPRDAEYPGTYEAHRPKGKIMVGGCPIQGGKNAASRLRRAYTQTPGGSTSCSLREKLGVGEEICSHCGEKGAVPPVQPAPVSVVVVGSLLWFARITGESTRR